MRSMRTSTLRGLTAAIIVACLVVGGVGCVDGQTPDCSDAAAHCGPDYDAYPPDTADDTSPSDAPNEGAADTGPADGAPDTPKDSSNDGGLLDGLLG